MEKTKIRRKNQPNKQRDFNLGRFMGEKAKDSTTAGHETRMDCHSHHMEEINTAENGRRR